MPASLEHISDSTPMGANLTDGGATFRVWAPNAHRVHACVRGAIPDDTNLLTRDERGHLAWLPAGSAGSRSLHVLRGG